MKKSLNELFIGPRGYIGTTTRILKAGSTLNYARIFEQARQDFLHHLCRAGAFLDRADICPQNDEGRIAAFLLHQASEQTCRMILLVFNGYAPCTHRLDLLMKAASPFSTDLADIFPRSPPDGDRYFNVLLLSYLDARYKNGFKVTKEEISVLTGRVRQLLEIGKRICENQISQLEKLAAQSG